MDRKVFKPQRNTIWYKSWRKLSSTFRKQLRRTSAPNIQCLRISTLILLKKTVRSAETYKNTSIILSCLHTSCNVKAVGIYMLLIRVIQRDQSQNLVSSLVKQPGSPSVQLTAGLHQTLAFRYQTGGPQTCREPINQHWWGNGICCLYCLCYLTGKNEESIACSYTVRTAEIQMHSHFLASKIYEGLRVLRWQSINLSRITATFNTGKIT